MSDATCNRLLLEQLSERISSSTGNVHLNEDKLQELLNMFASSEDKYVEYLCARQLSVSIHADQLQLVLKCERWHCFAQFCSFVLKVVEKNQKLEFIELVSLVSLCKFPVKYCQQHCQCLIYRTFELYVVKSSEITLSNLKSFLIPVVAQTKRCCQLHYLNLINCIFALESGSNHELIKFKSDLSTNDCITEQFLSSKMTTEGFACSKCSSPLKEMSMCDLVILRRKVLLVLAITRQKVDILAKKDDLLSLESIVKRNIKTSTLDKQWQWLMTLFVEEDALLLSAIMIVAQLLREVEHFDAIQELVESFLEAIHFDVNVLIDWLCSDHETANLLLHLLLFCLKLDQVTFSQNVQTTLSELNNKISSLSIKGLFPYNAKPLIKLLTNKIR